MLRCILNVVLFLRASSALLHPLVALVAKVGPLATVCSLLITCAARWHFTVWLVERLVAGLFGIAFPLPDRKSVV